MQNGTFTLAVIAVVATNRPNRSVRSKEKAFWGPNANGCALPYGLEVTFVHEVLALCKAVCMYDTTLSNRTPETGAS